MPKFTKSDRERGKHDVNLLSKSGRKLGGVKMPMNLDEDTKMGLMWYFISWHQKLKHMPDKLRRAYAKEVSEISAIMPIHLMGGKGDDSRVDTVLTGLKLKYFRYDDHRFLMLDASGRIMYRVTPMNLYALLIYLVDSLSKGLETHAGFEFIVNAKQLIAGDKNAK